MTKSKLIACVKCEIPLKPYWLKDGMCGGCRNPDLIVTSIPRPYTVKFTKEFVTGYLKGLMFDTTIDFPSLESANEYMNFLHAHKTTPVHSMTYSDYICHLARIER